MKKKVLLIRQSALAVLFCFFSGFVWGQSGAFVTRWSTNDQVEVCDYDYGNNCWWEAIDPFITIPTIGVGYNYNITWTNVTNPGVMEGSQNNVTGTYTITGVQWGDVYEVAITGSFPRFYMFPINGIGQIHHKLLSIEQWGNISWTSMEDAFQLCSNMAYNATDFPILSGVSSMANMFWLCSSMHGNPSINNWNTSTVTNMSGLFHGAELFNQPLGNWDVSNVTDMSEIFRFASSFNQPLANWDVSNVINMKSMFDRALNFNYPIGNWDVSNVTDMNSMFNMAQLFNQPIGNWNTTNVSIMVEMFRNASSFNQNLGSWPLANNVDLTFMLHNSGMDCENYSATLMGWANNPSTPNGRNLGALGRNYGTNAAAARAILTGTKGWTIAGDIAGSVACLSCATSSAIGTDIISSCAPITWIDGNTYSTSNNTATHLLVGAAQNGCDSLVTLNFTLWPCTQLRAIDCGATNVPINQILRAVQVGGQNYRFRVSGANNGGPGWNNNQFIYDTPIGQNHFRFQFIPGSAWGATYAVEVAVGDGFGNYGPYGTSCNVTLENQTTTQIVAATCGATVTMDNFVQANWAPGAIGYRFRIQGANNGGSGWSGNTFIYETTAPVRSFKFNNHIPGALFGETYSIEVAVLSGDNVWLPYGSACNVTIATPSTQIQASQCGATGVALSTSVLANNVIGASGYRFRITGANSANWVNGQTILDRPNRVIQFQMVAGVLPGEIYQVEVAVMDANGNYGAYGSSCNVTLAGTPSIVINDDSEMFMADKSLVEVAFGANASHNPFTTDFGIKVLNANDSDLINVTVYDMSSKLIERNAVNPMEIETVRFGSNLVAGMYMIEVRQGSHQAVIRQVKN
jgi:surface protein